MMSLIRVEFISHLNKINLFVYIVILFCISFLAFSGSAGLFDDLVSPKETIPYINSAYEINNIMNYFMKLFLFLIPVFVGNSLFKDFETNQYKLSFSFPIDKRKYLFSKFISSLSFVILITMSVGLAMIIVEFIPNFESFKLAPFNFYNYIQTYIYIIIPNCIIVSFFVFSIIILTRDIYASFVFIILMLLFQILLTNIFSENPRLIALLDPFAEYTVGYSTRFWTTIDKNSLSIILWPELFLNRLIWLILSGMIFYKSYLTFSFNVEFKTMKWFKFKKNNIDKTITEYKLKRSPDLNLDFTLKSKFQTIRLLSKLEVTYILSQVTFWGLVLFGFLAVFFALLKVTHNNDMILLPETGILLMIPSFFFNAITLLITFLYTGKLIFREKSANMNQLVDSMPRSNNIFILSKMMTIFSVQIILLSTFMIAAIAIQFIEGYSHIELYSYIIHLYGLNFVHLIVWTLTSFLIFTVIRSLYFGLFILILSWVGFGMLDNVGISTSLLQFNHLKPLFLSAFNGYGHDLKGYLVVQFYWVIWSVLFLMITYKLWVRGAVTSIKKRILNLSKIEVFFMVCLLCILLMVGQLIVQEEQKTFENDVQYSTMMKQKIEERLFPYRNIEQPSITNIKMTMDIFPLTNSFYSEGIYKIINRSHQVIDTLVIKTGFDEISNISLNVKYHLLDSIPSYGYIILKLHTPLKPNDKLEFKFQIRNKENTLFQRNSSVLNNGTFIKSDILPRLGYHFNSEIYKPDDIHAKKNHYFSNDEDLIDFEVVISTIDSQTPIAPGDLKRFWVNNGRAYASYKMNKKTKFGFSFHSAAYSKKMVIKDSIKLLVYYHKTHEKSTDFMLKGLQKALKFNESNFNTYPYKTASIIEFPNSEGSYATSFANINPLSEMRFIVNTKNTETINLPFYVAAHELTHQWWGNLVLPANALGATMITESITEYITSKIYENEFGRKEALRFIKKQRERYLRGRTNERGIEPPLYLVDPNRQYISYGKGALVFNSIEDILGQKKLLSILKSFLLSQNRTSGNYSTSLDLIQHIYNNSPGSIHQTLNDLFKKVLIYYFSIESAKVHKEGNNYMVQIKLFQKKEEIQNHKKVVIPFHKNETVDLDFIDEKGELINRVKYTLTDVNPYQIFNLKRKPFRVNIDSDLKFIEINIKNNSFDL